MFFPFTVQDVLSKKDTISHSNIIALPKVKEVFAHEPWQDDRFLNLKNDLNKQKSRLNGYDLNVWKQHTYRTNPARDVSRVLKLKVRPELLTIAWTKFYECVHNYNLIPRKAITGNVFNSLHLCEAPGAFIASLNHYLKLNHKNIKWNWKASTLNPYYEGNSASHMIADDRFIKHTLDRWDFGADFTGNILDWTNSQCIIENALKMGEIHLITADGSIDCSTKPEDQENVVASLHFCETTTALQALSKGGNFVLKMFTVYEHCSINLLYLLVNCFEIVNFFKPVTSKHGNSEIYIICLNYLGLDDVYFEEFKRVYGSENFLSRAMFPRLPESFLKKLWDISASFYSFQWTAIEANIRAFEDKLNQDEFFEKMKGFQRTIAHVFMKQTRLKGIDDGDKICREHCYPKSDEWFHRRDAPSGTFSERTDPDRSPVKKMSEYREEVTRICRRLRNLPLTIGREKIVPNFIMGAPLEKLNSSKFASARLLEIYREIGGENLENLPTVFEGGNVITFADEDATGRPENSDATFLDRLRLSLNSMKEGETLQLRNVLVLGQFRTGVVYALGMAGYENVTFSDDFSIQLRNLVDKEGCVRLLDAFLEEKSKRGASLLGVVDLKLALSEPLYSSVCNFNNHALAHRIFAMMPIAKE